MSRRASTGWDVLLVLAAVAAAFTKEAFALAIVGIAVFRAALWLRRAEHPSAIAVPPSVWLIPLAALIEMAAAAAVANSAGPFSHGGRYLVTPDPLAYVGSVAHNSAILVYVGMLWIAPLFVVAGLARNWRSVLLTCVPGAVLVLPQVLLYSLQGVFEGKYEAAPGLGVAAVSMAGIGWLKAQRKLRLYRVSLWAWSVALLAFGFSTWTYATYFTEDSIQLGMLVHAAAESQPTGTIGIAADPGRQYEPILSLLDHIRHQRPGPFEFEFLALAPDRPYSALEASLADNLMSASQAKPVERDCRGLSAMIVLGDEAATRANLPCLAQGFRRLEFSDSVLLWGGDGVSFRPRLPGLTHVGYVLFVADQSGAT